MLGKTKAIQRTPAHCRPGEEQSRRFVRGSCPRVRQDSGRHAAPAHQRFLCEVCACKPELVLVCLPRFHGSAPNAARMPAVGLVRPLVFRTTLLRRNSST